MAGDVSVADWPYQHTLKKYDNFFQLCCYGFSQGRKIPVYHRSLCDKKFYHSECSLTEHEPRHIADGQVRQR